MTPEEVRKIIREELMGLLANDKYTFQKHIQMFDGRNIQLAQGTGTQIGTEITQKVAFFGATPVIRQEHIADPSGGGTVDSQARTNLSLLNTLVENFGLTKTS